VQPNAAFCEDVIDKNGQEFGNDGKATHHWTSEGHEGKSVVNLVLGNQPITTWAILANDRATACNY